MDPAQKPDSRRLLTLGTLCVALIVAANLLIVPWLHEPAGEDRADSGAEEFPLEIRLLQELGPEAIEQLDDQTADADVPAQGAASAEMLDDGVPNSGSGQLGSGDDVVQSALACRVWGPIGVEGVVEALRQQIESAGDVIDIQASELSSDPDYLVYIDTDQNIDNARRL
ncbi:MAG: hypothetical protein KDI31_17370, partial [Pseudomonadales bacterium]|nr:hypothetical protein [Pseudomonadales bacterium]